jgi:hypothetical protein
MVGQRVISSTATAERWQRERFEAFRVELDDFASLHERTYPVVLPDRPRDLRGMRCPGR